jgi:hypothetical protein
MMRESFAAPATGQEGRMLRWSDGRRGGADREGSPSKKRRFAAEAARLSRRAVSAKTLHRSQTEDNPRGCIGSRGGAVARRVNGRSARGPEFQRPDASRDEQEARTLRELVPRSGESLGGFRYGGGSLFNFPLPASAWLLCKGLVGIEPWPRKGTKFFRVVAGVRGPIGPRLITASPLNFCAFLRPQD